jgi:hypothetical protein
MKKKISSLNIKKILPKKLIKHLVKSEFRISFKGLKLDNLEKKIFFKDISNYIKNYNFIKAGPHRINDWETGWGENLKLIKKNNKIANFIPKYFLKNNVIRIRNDLILTTDNSKPEIKLLEKILLSSLRYAHKYKFHSEIMEFGSGTGYNLLSLANEKWINSMEPFEWSKSGIRCCNYAGKLCKKIKKANFFDFYQSSFEKKIDNKIILTVAALEQTGKNFGLFLKNCMEKTDNCIFINLEPIQELMPNTKLGKLSQKYAKKRKYLSGFYSYLKKKEKKGKIKILLESKAQWGSKYLNGPAILIWEKI